MKKKTLYKKIKEDLQNKKTRFEIKQFRVLLNYGFRMTELEVSSKIKMRKEEKKAKELDNSDLLLGNRKFRIIRGCPCGVMVKAMDCGIVVSEFVL